MSADLALLQSIAVFGATTLGLFVAVLAASGLWQAMTDERRLLLSELLEREGVDMSEHVRGAGARQFALAARTCVDCRVRGRCEDWLSSPSREGYQSFCPNAAYVARLKHADR